MRLVVTLLAAPMLAAACAGQSPAPHEAAPDATATPTATAAGTTAELATPSPPSPVATSSAAAALPPPPDRTEPGIVGCGGQRCKVGAEVCCREGSTSLMKCVPSLATPAMPASEEATIAALEAQRDVCRQALGPGSFGSVMQYCDESADCPGGGVCCSVWADLGLWGDLCLPTKAPSSGVCPYLEMCVEGSACQTKGTACEDGSCLLAAREIRCGNEVCRGETATCCVRDGVGRCADRCAEEDEIAVACDGPKDCPGGARCCAGRQGSACAGFCELYANAIVCDSDTDCAIAAKWDTTYATYRCSTEDPMWAGGPALRTCEGVQKTP
jgi:hypothetical protein